MEYDDLFIAVDFNTLFAKGRPSWIRSKRESGKSPHSKITRLLNCDADKLWSGSVPMITRKRIATVFILAACCAATASAEPAVDGLSRARWAKRLPGGPVKVVFLAPYGAQQDSFELMQRFDIDGTVVTMAALDTRGYQNGLQVSGHYWPQLWPNLRQVRDTIRQAVAGEWEAIVMGWIPVWSEYPEDIRRSILERVSAGRTLIIGSLETSLANDVAKLGHKLEETALDADRFAYSDSDDGGLLSEPPVSVAQTARVYRCGAGRVVHFHVPNYAGHGYLLSDSPRQSDFEFSTGRAGWFLVRAARSSIQPCVTGMQFVESAIVVELDDQPPLRSARVQVTIHRCDTYQKVLEVDRVYAPGKHALPLPQLAAGEHQAEVRVTNRERTTVDWNAIRFTITGRVTLKAISPNKKDVQPGEQVSCRLEVQGEVENLKTVVRWYDHWDRLLLVTAPEPFSEEIKVTVPAGSLSVLNHLEVTLRSDRGPEAVARAELLLPENVRPTDFYMLYWKGLVWKEHSPGSWRRRLLWDVLRRRGAADAWSNCKANGREAREAALNHLRTVPYTASFHQVSIDKAERDPLLSEERLVTMEKDVRQRAGEMRPYNPLAHTLGDENYVTNKPEGRFADTPRAWAAFQQYLRSVYPDLEALNAQWGIDFAAWDKIRFDNEAQMLTDMDNPSAWVDYRMFVTHHFVDAHRRMRRAIREGDPGVSVGWDGATQFSSYNGQDWWELCRDMELVQTYQNAFVPDAGYPWWIFNGQAMDSFGRTASLRGLWMNKADFDFGGRYVPWHVLLNGWNSIWWWQATFLHPANGPVRWDMKLTPIAEPMVAAVKEIKQGPGTLLAHARKDASPIAVHYSATNYHASTIESGVANYLGNLGKSAAFWMASELARRSSDIEMRKLWGGITPKGHYAVASANFYLLLNDMGFEPRTVARQEIETGSLVTSGIRVLVLPFVVSLSDLEVTKIREFMTRGGILIADYRCGLRDEHGRLREKPALDDVFGIQRKSLEVRRQPGTFTANFELASAQFPTVFHDPVALDGSAEAWGYHDDGTPGYVVNYALGGKSLYLNADLTSYLHLRRRGGERDVRELLTAFLTVRDALTMFPPFQVKLRQGHAAGRIEVTRFSDRDTRYYGVLPAFDVDDKAARRVVLPFPEGTHVYDVRARQYVGRGGPIEVTIEPGEPKMYAALPYKVTGLSINAPRGVTRGKPVDIRIAVTAPTGDVGPHAVRIEVSLPDGRQPEYLARTLYLPKGEEVFSFVPALNSPAGQWSASAVEVISGKRTSAHFDVR